MTDHFQAVVDHVMSDDESELGKVKAERDFALHCLERELAIAQQAQAEITRLRAELLHQQGVMAGWLIEKDEALKPFADLVQFVTEAHRDSRPIIFGLDTVIAQRLTIGHLRAAFKAMAPAERPDVEKTGECQ